MLFSARIWQCEPDVLSAVKNTVELDMLVKFTVIHLNSVGIEFLLAVYFRFIFFLNRYFKW